MLLQVGGHGLRPTFFEMVAALHLPHSLRAALSYSIGVFALRRPFLHKVLDFEDEFYALLMLVLESHSLRTTDSSFSESLYGLKRRSVKMMTEFGSRFDSQDDIQHSHLERSQRHLSVILLVLLPYLKSKLHTVYNKEREARLQARLWRSSDPALEDTDSDNAAASFGTPGERSESAETTAIIVKKRIQKLIFFLYPWIHASSEGLTFTYQLLYLLDATIFYSFGLHILGVCVTRATGDELMESSARISKIRSHERARLRGPAWLKMLQGALLRASYATLDYAQTALIASVFMFKIMEWWYQSAEERLSAPTTYPPPPPPPPPKIAEGGIQSPSDKTLCPLCSQKRANPSVLASSGFVFCYACIHRYVSQYNQCPVTMVPAKLDDVRRLFHDVS